GMIDPGQEDRLPDESVDDIAGGQVGEDLHGDPALQGLVLGPIDDPHPAATELVLDPTLAEDPPRLDPRRRRWRFGHGVDPRGGSPAGPSHSRPDPPGIAPALVRGPHRMGTGTSRTRSQSPSG